jgi:hypothetical protein
MAIGQISTQHAYQEKMLHAKYAPRERPILFSAPMVRAILEGRKTQTRRILTVPWHKGRRARPYEPYYVDNDGRLEFCDEYGDYHDYEATFLSPYGRPGDRLWVKESIRRDEGFDSSSYIADGAPTVADAWPWKNKALPSIHCPRGLSRITLEVTRVRVERLTSISKADARAEGVTLPLDGDGMPCGSPVTQFAELWESINGKGAWHANPWVWVIEFRKMEGS